MTDTGRSQRGQPVWRALAVLVLFPLAVAAVMGGLSVQSASRSAHQAEGAQRLVAAVERLDAARRAVDAEVLPAMLLGVLRDQHLATKVGFPPERTGALRASQPARMSETRATTDQALAAAASTHGIQDLDAVLGDVRASLRTVRAEADGGGSLQAAADAYRAITSTLASAQRRANADAIASGLSTRSVAALQDLDLVVQLSETASRQLAELFASRVLPEPASSSAQRRWIATWGTYAQLVSSSARLSNESVRISWSVFQSSSEVASFSQLLDRQALDPQEAVIETGALPALAARSGRRDAAVAVVMDDAVSSVTAAASADRAQAVSREQALLVLFLALVVLCLLFAGLVARWLTGSMRTLAASAQEVSLGHLVDVEVRGPRELRTAARALSSAVAGLRRVQEQAKAVVAGDLEAALRQQPLPGPLGDVVHASVEQIVEAFRAREELQDELSHQASHDALTGLVNRAQTLRELSITLQRERRGLRTGVMFIDLDGFKAVNDTHGHAAGDELLREVARRLSDTLRPGDVVGRLGGDEFVVLIAGAKASSDLVDLGWRLVAATARPVTIRDGDGEKQVNVGASIGVAMSSDDVTPDALLVEADQAAYRAKRLGRGRVELFDDALRAELCAQADLDVALREALKAGELALHYQPVVSLRSGELVGYEALARWYRPGVGPVPPDVFIPVAEASMLVCDLGRWALAEATRQVAHWRTQGRAGFAPGAAEPSVAVNISARHLTDRRIVNDVSEALTSSGLPPRLLILEITETVLMNDPRATRHLQELRELGVVISIDDFGTGYTSIGALASTPADILKIDRSFVDTDDPGRHQLTTLITQAAHTFSMRVIAEGIETPAQLARAQADGCEEGQGYLFSRPLPPEEIEALTYRFFPPHIPTQSAGPDDRRLAPPRSTP